MKDRTCEERLPEHLAGRMEDFRSILAGTRGEGIDPDTGETWDEDTAHERIHEYGLCLTVERLVTIQLSTGGPGDQLEYTLDADGLVTEIRYRFLDWFDGAVVTLTGDDFETARDFYACELELIDLQ